MPYAIKFYLFLFVLSVSAFLIGVRLAPLGLVALVVLMMVLAYLAILLGRWLLGRKNLLGRRKMVVVYQCVANLTYEQP